MKNFKKGRCFTCKHCLTCIDLISQVKNPTEETIIKVCKNNNGYESLYPYYGG